MPFPRWSALALVALAAWPHPARAQIAPSRIVLDVPGPAPAARLGESVTGIGDFDGDGRADFAVGVPGWGPGASDSSGRVLVYLGGRELGESPALVIDGVQRGSQFGVAVSGIGDVNLDGFDDFAVGAPGWPQLDGSGRAFVYYGGYPIDGAPDLTLLPPVLEGRSARGFGNAVIPIGDANGDGTRDWGIGFENTPRTGGNGGCFVYLGGQDPPTVPENWAASSGVSGRPTIAPIGDFNGDGRDDLAIGYPTLFSGFAHVLIYFGSASSGSLSPNTQLRITSTTMGFGTALASPGDLDGDGFSEVLMGTPVAGGGEVWLLRGRPSGPNGRVESVATPLSFGSPLPDSFGSALAARPVPGTGVELLVGACGDDTAAPGAGAAFLYRLTTPFAPPTLLGTARGTGAGDYLGLRIALPGDVDGNGEGELLLGAPHRSSSGARSGAFRVATLSPHTLQEPAAGTEWRWGGDARVRWTGAAPARVSLSTDAGASWTTLADGAGGAPDNERLFAVPPVVSGRARVRLSPAGRLAQDDESDAGDIDFPIVAPAPAWAAATRFSRQREAAPGVGRLGAALAGTRDFDGDGRPDLAVGAPDTDGPAPNSGAVWVGPTGAEHRIDGAGGGDRFGAAVALGGDPDRDGRPDLLVGAPGRAGRGAASLFLRGDPSEAALEIAGEQADEALGSAVAWLGDFDGDGEDDFAIASPWFDAGSGRGRAGIWLGGPALDATRDFDLRPSAGVEGFGAALAALDLNGDGAGDLAVSARSASGGPGLVFVYFGGPGADAVPDLRLRSARSADRFGEALASAGDPNGDGIEDLLVGAPGATGPRGETGCAYLFAGSTRPSSVPTHVFAGDATGEDFGAAVAGGGDVNGDGRDDVVVGAPLAGGGRGAARLFFGGSDHAADGEWSGMRPDGRFGSALAIAPGAGGGAEVLCGAPLEDVPQGSGAVHLLAAPRFAIDAPAPGAGWFSGSDCEIRWRGAEPADVTLSVDGGRTWQSLAAGAGGAVENVLIVRAPSVTTDSAFVSLRTARAGVPGLAVQGPFAIGTGTHVARFDWEPVEEGIRFRWRTEPGLGAGRWSAYRLYRVHADGSARRLGPDAVLAEELVVPEFERGGLYALRAVDGNGTEFELAQLRVEAPRQAFAAWPVPSRGDVELSLFPPVEAGGRTPADFALDVFDLNGRLVRGLALGAVPTRAGELRLAWDRRALSGDFAGPGVYFVRAVAPSRGFRIDRRIVVLH